MKKYTSHCIIPAILLFALFSSCKEKQDSKPKREINGNYFSIRQFVLDQWNTFQGEPFTILKTVKLNGKTDSSFTNSDTLNWGPIFKTFFETDISDHQLVVDSDYTFTQFDDNEEDTHNFYYKANDLDFFTQKLLITMARENYKVKGIYIETYKKTLWDECKQILYYEPMHTIQIQTDDKPVIGGRKYKVLTYYFMR